MARRGNDPLGYKPGRLEMSSHGETCPKKLPEEEGKMDGCSGYLVSTVVWTNVPYRPID